MIDHMTVAAKDVDATARFYAAALAPLGMVEIGRDGDAVGFGGDAWRFGVAPGAPEPLHIAFAAPSPDAVRAFHEAELAAGGVCNGPPGLRPEYGDAYFAAFVVDPDGRNVEAVFRGA